jgi:hypothetical protein
MCIRKSLGYLSDGTCLCTAAQPSVSIVERDGHQFVSPIRTQHTVHWVRIKVFETLVQDCVKQIWYCSRHLGKESLHGLINYKDTKIKCRHLKDLPVKGLCSRCLLEFIDWRYSQSCWYFRPSFVNYCPSNLLSGSHPPPLPLPVSKYSIYLYTVQRVRGWEWVWGGVGWVLSPVGCWRPYSAGV